ncbi:hypothetical protein Hanom_Chr07g00628841 [Helianthus anomalus]
MLIIYQIEKDQIDDLQHRCRVQQLRARMRQLNEDYCNSTSKKAVKIQKKSYCS